MLQTTLCGTRPCVGGPSSRSTGVAIWTNRDSVWNIFDLTITRAVPKSRMSSTGKMGEFCPARDTHLIITPNVLSSVKYTSETSAQARV